MYPQKSVGVAYLFWIVLGLLGGHQFYLGKIGRGILYVFTLGGFGVMFLIDLFTLPSQVRTVNAQLAAQRPLGLGAATVTNVYQAPPPSELPHNPSQAPEVPGRHIGEPTEETQQWKPQG